MFKSKLSALTVGALLALGAASSANALTLTAGNYKIEGTGAEVVEALKQLQRERGRGGKRSKKKGD